MAAKGRGVGAEGHPSWPQGQARGFIEKKGRRWGEGATAFVRACRGWRADARPGPPRRVGGRLWWDGAQGLFWNVRPRHWLGGHHHFGGASISFGCSDGREEGARLGRESGGHRRRWLRRRVLNRGGTEGFDANGNGRPCRVGGVEERGMASVNSGDRRRLASGMRRGGDERGSWRVPHSEG